MFYSRVGVESQQFFLWQEVVRIKYIYMRNPPQSKEINGGTKSKFDGYAVVQTVVQYPSFHGESIFITVEQFPSVYIYICVCVYCVYGVCVCFCV